MEPLFTVQGPAQLKVPPCSTLRVPISVGLGLNAPPGFAGPVTLSASGVPADDAVSFSPATLSLPGETQSIMTLTSQSDVASAPGQITVTASGGGVTDSSNLINVTRVPPSITGLTDSSGTRQLSGGQTPQGASPDLGTLVIVHGQGFCPGSTVFFGNARAAATTQGPFADGLGPFGDETAIRTAVPSLATTGNLYVVPAGGGLSSPGTATAPFTIDSYRNTNGFAFDNSDAFQNAVGGYSFSDVSDVFGDEQTHVSVNPCWPFGDCSIVTPIPDPFALIFWGVVDQVLRSGQCFGFSLASQRLLHGDQSFAPFPLQPGAPAGVWNIQGPDAAGGPSGQIAHFIHLMHMEQFSREALGFWLTTATSNAIFGSQSSLMNDVTSALNAGDHPLVEMRNGTEGHVVVAYGVDQANGSGLVQSGDRVIDVYNPNQEFLAGENAPDGGTHQTTMSTSEIVVHPNGHWEFQGFSPEWHGGPGSLIVMPYGTVPVHPNLPFTVSNLFSLLFGSANATQVTDAHGHTLLTRDGSINTDPATGIRDATQFATLSGTPTPGPGIFLFGHRGTYTTTVQGTASGTYHDAVFGNGMAGSISAAVRRGITDGISVPAGADGLTFGQQGGARPSSARPTTVQLVVRGAGGAAQTATVATTVPSRGRAGVTFTAGRRALTVTGGAQSASALVTLSWTGPHGLPQTFVARAIHLGPGDRATLTPARWSSLGSTPVVLRLAHPDGRITRTTLHNLLRPAGRYAVALGVSGRGHSRRLTVAVRFRRLPPSSSALLTWQVLRGRTPVAEHRTILTGSRLHLGLVRQTFSVRGGSLGHDTFTAHVALLSRSRSGAELSQVVSRTRRL